MAYDKVVDSVKLDNDLSDIANAISQKAEPPYNSDMLSFPNGFIAGINSIKTGGNTPTPSEEKTVNIKTNGTQVVTPDYGYLLSKVTINTNVPISGGSGTNNCEAVIVIPPNVPKFKGTNGTVKLWGWGQGKSPTGNTWDKPNYLFVGSGYTEYIGGEETPLNLSVNSLGQVTGIPELLEGKYLATLGI